MANEAILVQQLEDRLFEATVADGTGIEKGTIMVWSGDNNTVSASSADGNFFAGIAATEKVANDGKTRISLWRRGVFAIKCAAAGTAVLGKPVKIAGANLINAADDSDVEEIAECVGIALETGSAGETINVLVGHL